METIGFIWLAFIFTLANALFDANLIKSEKYFIDHRPRFILRVLFVGLMSFISIDLAIYAAVIFICTFDYILNILLDRDLLSLGNTAKWDLFWKDKPLILLALRIILLTLTILFI